VARGADDAEIRRRGAEMSAFIGAKIGENGGGPVRLTKAGSRLG
jgi:hypothetical protein